MIESAVLRLIDFLNNETGKAANGGAKKRP
jgi:hypothetical protein